MWNLALLPRSTIPRGRKLCFRVSLNIFTVNKYSALRRSHSNTGQNMLICAHQVNYIEMDLYDILYNVYSSTGCRFSQELKILIHRSQSRRLQVQSKNKHEYPSWGIHTWVTTGYFLHCSAKWKSCICLILYKWAYTVFGFAEQCS